MLIEDKLSPAQLRSIYSELTGDWSVNDNIKCQEIDEHMHTTIKTVDLGILRDLRINNSRKAKFDNFRDVRSKKTEELQAFTVNDPSHAEAENGEVINNVALAISVRVLYEQCVEAAKASHILDENIPSRSWFRFQFWPKNPYTHAALNYTGQLKVRYMVQQRAIPKNHVGDHYCVCLYKYVRDMAVTFNKHVALVSRGDKNKIKVGEPDCPISAINCGHQVPAANGHLWNLLITTFLN